jgi:hypothetical protein
MRRGGRCCHRPPLSQLHGPPAGAASRWAGGLRSGAWPGRLPVLGLGGAEAHPIPCGGSVRAEARTVPPGRKQSPKRLSASHPVWSRQAEASPPFRTRPVRGRPKPTARPSGLPPPAPRASPLHLWKTRTFRPKPFSTGFPSRPAASRLSPGNRRIAGEPAVLAGAARVPKQASDPSPFRKRLFSKAETPLSTLSGTNRAEACPIPFGVPQSKQASVREIACRVRFGASPSPSTICSSAPSKVRLPCPFGRPEVVPACGFRRLHARLPLCRPVCFLSCAIRPGGTKAHRSGAAALAGSASFPPRHPSGYEFDAVTESESREEDSCCG